MGVCVSSEPIFESLLPFVCVLIAVERTCTENDVKKAYKKVSWGD